MQNNDTEVGLKQKYFGKIITIGNPEMLCYTRVMQCLECNQTFVRSASDIKRGRTSFCSIMCSRQYKHRMAENHANKVARLGRKQCKLCHKTRKLIYFPKSKSSLTGYYSYCYDCKRGINRQQDEKRKLSASRKEWSRKAYLKRTYGMTSTEYDSLKKAQNGGCAICASVVKLAVDHDHKTGKIRGLLCHNCNRGLGMFYDNTSSLREAIKYLS